MRLKDYFRTRGAPTQVSFALKIGMSPGYMQNIVGGYRLAGERWIGPIVKGTKGKVTPRDLNRRLAPLFTARGDRRA